jgi:hypothetical protein
LGSIDEKYLLIAGKPILADPNDPVGWISGASVGCREVPAEHAAFVEEELFIPELL